MPSVQPPKFFSHLRTLFGVGTLSGLGEGELLEQFLSHRDETAFEEIVARHGPMILGICRRWLKDTQDAEDAFQAVFLILVRKAASLRDRNSLSSWLYGVTMRVAQRARANAAHQHSRDHPIAEALAMGRATQDRTPDHETQLILDEEIGRLPEKQQAAIVLCLVQGKTHEVAATELGCPLGTVKTRIAAGKATLARKLARRGLAPSIALGAASISENLMARSVPNELLRQTVEAATRFSLSRSISGAAIAASVQNLIHGVLSTMRLARMKSIAIGLAIAGILVGASTALVLARSGQGREAGDPKPVAKVTPSTAPAKLDLYGDPIPAGATMRFGTIRHRQESPIYRIAFTRDDRFIVTDGDDGQLRIWDGHDGKLVRRIRVPIDALGDFAITADGQAVATTGINFVKGSGFVRHVVFNQLATGRQVSEHSWVEKLILPKVALDPDRQLLVTAAGGQLAITRVDTGKETAHAILENEAVKYLEFSADRNRLAVASEVQGNGELHGRRLRVFDIQNTGDFRSVARFDVDCDNLAFSPAGNLFVGTQHPSTLTFLDVPSGTPHQIERTYINQMVFSTDGKTIAGIRTPGDMLVFWNPVAKRYIDLLKTSSRLAGQLAFSSDRRTIAANGGRNVLHLWDIASGRERGESTVAHEDRINAVLAARGGEMLITASADRTIRMWSMSTGRQLKALNHEDRVATLSLSADGRFVIAGMDLQLNIYLWSIEGDGPPAILKAPEGTETLALTFVDTDRSILAMGGDGIIRRWNSGDRRLVNEVSLKSLLKPMELDPRITEEFTAATFFDGGRKLALTSIGTGLHIVDVQSGKETGRVPDAKLVAGSPDSKTLAIARNGSGSKYKRMGNETIIRTVSPSGTIVLIDANNNHEIHQIEIPNSEVWSLAFSPDSKTLAATSGWETGQIHLYEVATGKEFRTIETPAIRTPALTFTPDGSKLVCGMADTSVLVWDVAASP